MEENELEKKTDELIPEEADIPETSGGEAALDRSRAKRIAAEVYSWFDTFFFPLFIVMVLFTFFMRMSRVDGTSMLPTLEDGQQLMISDVLYEPAYNDIVVVWSENLPTDDGGHGKAIVKRVIGLPGDSIHIDYTAGTVTRNGTVLPIEIKDGLLYEDGHIINDYTNRGPGQGRGYDDYNVPDGSLFVMGDNRNGSTDSRWSMIGFIDRRDVIGKAYIRIWPLNTFRWLYD